MKKQNHNSVKVLMILLVMFLIINIYFIFNNFNLLKNITSIQNNITLIQPDEYEIIKLSDSYTPLSIKGFTKVQTNLDKNFMLHLVNNCSSLDMPTNEYQAYSIVTGIKGSIDVRPTMHDITNSLFNDFNISIIMTQIVDRRDELYIANMFVKQNNKITSIDIKPSDAIAMSFRTNTSIYVKNDLMIIYANKTC